jgi:hypothetical protein
MGGSVGSARFIVAGRLPEARVLLIAAEREPASYTSAR